MSKKKTIVTTTRKTVGLMKGEKRRNQTDGKAQSENKTR